MAAEITAEVVGIAGAQQFIRNLAPAFDSRLRRGLAKGGAVLFREVQERLHAAPGPSSDRLHVRSGKLSQSLAMTPPEREGAGYKVRVGFRKGPAGKYAALHEFGGTIRPKGGRLLAIPIGKALTAAGVPRFSSPRQVSGGFWLGGKSSTHAVFFVREGKRGKLTPLFVGVPSVRIPARKPLRGSLAAKRIEIGRVIAEEIGAQ